MSDKADDILKELAKLKPDQMREVIENLATQSGVSNDTNTQTLRNLPNRLSVEDILNEAKEHPTKEERYHWHIVSGLFDTMVSSRDAGSSEDAVKFAYDKANNQPWYPIGINPPISLDKPKMVLYEEWRKWVRKE